MTTVRFNTLYRSRQLRVSLDAGQFLRLEARSSSVHTVYAPAIMEATVVPCTKTTGYIHLTGAFQSTTLRGQRRGLRRLGPFPLDEAHGVVASMSQALTLPRAPIEVSYEQLEADPARYRDCIVRCRGLWQRGGGASYFAGARLVPPDQWNTYGELDASHESDGVLVDVVGLWACTSVATGAGRPGAVVFDAYLLEALPDLSGFMTQVRTSTQQHVLDW